MDLAMSCSIMYKILRRSNPLIKVEGNHLKWCLKRAKSKSISSGSTSNVQIGTKSATNEEAFNSETKQNQDDEGEAREKLRSKHPFQNLFSWKSRAEFHKDLLERIVHNGDGLVALNKPFGVGVKHMVHKNKTYGSAGIEEERNLHLRGIGTTDYTLQEAIPFLREALQKPELVLMKSTERMTSGLAVFAENNKQAEKFGKRLAVSKSQSNQNPLYKYHIITAATPYTNETSFKERVGICLRSSPLSDVKQSVIERQFSKNQMKRGEVKPVHVQVNVLSRNTINKTALLEVQTSSTRWNFLRVYCADLLIPIMGDHLYSCRIRHIMGVPAKIDPTHVLPGSSDQKLSMEQLDALELRNPEESIRVPPHIHLHSYTLHNYMGKGKSITLEAPSYPEFFKWTCDKLNLYY